MDLHPVDWTANIQDIKSDSSQRSLSNLLYCVDNSDSHQAVFLHL
jgi:hypothetical protein